MVENDPVLSNTIGLAVQEAGFLFATFPSAEDLLAADGAKGAACLLLDASLTGMSGIELLIALGRAANRVPVVMITGRNDAKTAVAAMKAGAFDLLEKPVTDQALLKTLARAIRDTGPAPELGELQAEATAFIARLTNRERDVLDLIVDGQPNKVIAANLSIGQRTVETHRAAIMRKAGTRSLPAVARMALAARLPPTAPTAPTAPDPETDSGRFERYFDQIPLAVVIATMDEPERLIYANPAFEQLSGQTRAEIEGHPWTIIPGVSSADAEAPSLGDSMSGSSDLVGTFRIGGAGDGHATVEVFANVIVDDTDRPAFRLAALVDVGAREGGENQAFEAVLREKDTQLLEIHHRVKNNLQMITALIRIEARKARQGGDVEPFDRLAGRVSAIQHVYKLLTESGARDEVDLGVYLSEVASSVMHAAAVEGIRLELKVDAYPVSVNVALPAGMVVNELLTNALKHAFVDRAEGTITLHSLTDKHGCRVIVADDGVGLPPGVSWPRVGKLGHLIVQSLRQNARADIQVESRPGAGMRVTIGFTREAAASRAA
jgi:PAS domain S-box-containing protein